MRGAARKGGPYRDSDGGRLEVILSSVHTHWVFGSPVLRSATTAASTSRAAIWVRVLPASTPLASTATGTLELELLSRPVDQDLSGGCGLSIPVGSFDELAVDEDRSSTDQGDKMRPSLRLSFRDIYSVIFSVLLGVVTSRDTSHPSKTPTPGSPG